MEICAASDAQAIQDFVAAQERSYRAQGGELGESAMIDFDRFAFEFAAKRLSEVAPVRAADIWSGSPLLPTELFLGAWARHFPADFVAWWRELPVDLQRESAPALGSLAAFSPEAFQSAANVLAASPAAECAAAEAYRATISPSVSEMFSANGPTWDAARAIQFLHSLPEGALRSGVLPLLVGDLLVFEEEQKWDLRDHPEFGSVFAQLPEDKVMAISPVSLARLERQAAHLPPCPMRDYAVLYGFRNGALEDPALAAEKLQSVSAQDYPAAVHGFAIGAADEDPVAALQWALSIDPSSAHRGKALERAAAAFFRQDPERARRWVEKAALSDGEYRLLTGHDRLN
jgi:hypothetical protein